MRNLVNPSKADLDREMFQLASVYPISILIFIGDGVCRFLSINRSFYSGKLTAPEYDQIPSMITQHSRPVHPKEKGEPT